MKWKKSRCAASLKVEQQASKATTTTTTTTTTPDTERVEARKQYLIESSKQFNTKHGSSARNEHQNHHHHQLQHNNNTNHQLQQQQAQHGSLYLSGDRCFGSDNMEMAKHLNAGSVLGLFRSTSGNRKVTESNKVLRCPSAMLADEQNFAFDNPYFRDEQQQQVRYLQQQQQQQKEQQQQEERQQQQQQQQDLLDAAESANKQQDNSNKNMDQQQQQQQQHELDHEQQQVLPNNEQLHFIEHHISNLHNRQVTSSVKELSILGSHVAEQAMELESANTTTAQDQQQQQQQQHELEYPLAGHVVDLTSDEQRSKVLADPKEGDLVAVDLSGEDIIGLGFDVFGSPQTGIFIKSVLARGPARDSGCMEAGDRIKCLNISFENITLQDATDILNCAAPYKMRLLLEKRVVVPARQTPSKKFAITFRAQTQKQSKAPAI